VTHILIIYFSKHHHYHNFQGDHICGWLDNEIADVRGSYEEEIRILEGIIADLRKSPGKKRRKSKSIKVPQMYVNIHMRTIEYI
jgi:hypothetical protein